MSETKLERPLPAPMPDGLAQSFDFDRRAFALRIVLCACFGACSVVISVFSWSVLPVILLLSIALPLTIAVAWFSALRLRMPPPVIVLDTNGVWDQRLEAKPVPWGAVRAIELDRDSDVVLVVSRESGDATAGNRNRWRWLPFFGSAESTGKVRIKLDEIAATLPEFLAAVDAVLPHNMQAPGCPVAPRRRPRQLVRPLFAGVVSGMMVGLLIATVGASRQSSTIYRGLGTVKDLGVPLGDTSETRLRRFAGQGLDAATDDRVRLGYLYHAGIGAPRDDARAARQFGLAAADGVAEAQAALGYFRENGIGVAQDFVKARSWYRKAAEQGDAWARARLALMYRDGRGVSRNQEKAFELFQAAARQGERSAQYFLGEAFENGWGVAENAASAIEWYGEAAAQGHAKAEYKLGSLHREGRSVPRSETRAVVWFERSARKGYAPAQYALGVAHELGLSVPRDPVQAAFWYYLAEWHGHPAAAHRRAQLLANLDRGERQAAYAYRRRWLQENLLSEAAVAKLGAYRRARGPKAFAASMDGAFAVAADARDESEAAQLATSRCRRFARTCLLYALGDRIVIGMGEPKIDALAPRGGQISAR